jgi:hypothetical protein
LGLAAIAVLSGVWMKPDKKDKKDKDDKHQFTIVVKQDPQDRGGREDDRPPLARIFKL